MDVARFRFLGNEVSGPDFQKH